MDFKLQIQGSPAFTPREVLRSTTKAQKRAVRREIIKRTLAKDVDSVKHVKLMDRETGGIIIDPKADRTPLITTENVADGIFMRTRPSVLASHFSWKLSVHERGQMENDRNTAHDAIAYVGLVEEEKIS